jgi:hypothetical protein
VHPPANLNAHVLACTLRFKFAGRLTLENNMGL